MNLILLRHAAFHLHRLARAQPYLCGAILVSGSLLIAAAVALAGVRDASSDAIAEHSVLLRSSKRSVSTLAEPVSAGHASLQSFSSSQLVQVLNDVANQTNLSINEISFTFDEGNAQPFLRYRASFSLNAKYLAVRRFIDSVHAGVPDVSLDSVSCARETIGVEVLKCDLVFSAFYAKGDRG